MKRSSSCVVISSMNFQRRIIVLHGYKLLAADLSGKVFA